VIDSSSSRPSASATGLDVRPFRALTYRDRDPEHLARVSSPAYDLVTPDGRRRLAASDPHNVVRLILPLSGPGGEDTGTGDGDGDAERVSASAQLAAETLRRWQQERVLVRDDEPALWLYELHPLGGGAVTAGWLGAVALPPPGSTAVLPHEDTYPRAVEGRRALLAATRTDLEPIVLAHDPDADVSAVTDEVRRGVPDLTVRDVDEVRHRLWRVTDPLIIDRLTSGLGRTDAVIADGHHRFAAARAHHRTADGGPGSDRVLALLTPMGPGGLRVDAIHRVVPGLGLDAALDAAAAGFRVTREPGGTGSPAGAIGKWMADPHQSGFLITDGTRLAHLSDPSADVCAAVPPEAPPPWRGLDVVLAHHGLLGRLWQRPDDPGSVLIAHSVGEALRTAEDRAGVAVLLRPPSPADVAAVARAGARMPRKSTLFVPKPRTGLLLRPLTD
jgi:uncharacterized protein (DUF1015 family)